MSTVEFVLQQTLIFFIPLLLVALGAMFSERGGVLNIGLEGIMIFGAFCGLLFINKFHGILSPQVLLFAAILVSMGSGMLFTLPHAFASITLKADQTISGTALNLFAPAFCIFMARVVQNVQQIGFVNDFRIDSVPLLGKIPVIGEIFFQKTYITTFIGLAIFFFAWLVINKSQFGLRLRACGENPHSADSAGVNVIRMRYAGVLLSGALGGLGGLVYVIPTTTTFSSTVSGYGFLAIAVLIFGQWRPAGIAFAALFFGFMKTIASSYTGIAFLSAMAIPDTVYKIIPYATTLVLLMLTSKKTKSPASAGIPYSKSDR